MLPDHRLGDLDGFVPGAQGLRHGCGAFALIGRAGRVEAGGEGEHRLAVQPRHQGEQRGAVDAAREEHAVGHVAALVQIHALLQRAVQARERGVLGRSVSGPPSGSAERRRRSMMCPSAQVRVSPGSDAVDALEDGFRAGGELQLQQLVASGLAEDGADQARSDAGPAARRRRRGRRRPVRCRAA